MAPKRHGNRRQAASSAASSAEGAGVQFQGASALRFGFGAAIAVLVVLNTAVLALWPYWQEGPQEGSTGLSAPIIDCDEPPPAAVPLVPEVTSATGQSELKVRGWSELATSPLQRIGSTSSLRLQPPPGPQGDVVAQKRRWLTFGLSSIRRPKIEYLGITLSRLFHALEDSDEFAIVVHLADFNEAWVAQTSARLREQFLDEIASGRLHAIHAPQRLYPLKQAALTSVTLGGFKSKHLNVAYAKDDNKQVNGRETYWTSEKASFLYWCAQKEHRRWSITEASSWDEVVGGACPAVARAPEDHDVLDPLVMGWEENRKKSWSTNVEAGVDSINVEAGAFLKFGDSPQRQWWRTKQNLDYAFLMWYVAGLSDFYMQLEDDIQVVPNFVHSVRSYINRNLLGREWMMVSYSKLGFIGKFFNSSRLPSLAEFLFVYSAESPCDWLVWDWIDIFSSEPVTGDIAKDLMKEHEERVKARKEGPEAVAKLPAYRSDLTIYYKSLTPLFQTEPAQVSKLKPPLERNGKYQATGYPMATVWSSMRAYQHYEPSLVYPPVDAEGFWSSDACWDKRDKLAECMGAGQDAKFLEVAFDESQLAHGILVEMGVPGHVDDYMREGSLQVATKRRRSSSDEPQGCTGYVEVSAISQPQTRWESTTPQRIICARVVLKKTQSEWIRVRAISILGPDGAVVAAPRALSEGASSVDVVPRRLEAVGNIRGSYQEHQVEASTPASRDDVISSAILAALAGISASMLGWLAVYISRKVCAEAVQLLGPFACWALGFIMALDVVFLLALTPPRPPARQAPAVVRAPCPKAAAALPLLTAAHLTADSLRPGIQHVDAEAMRAQGGPGPTLPTEKWLVMGIVADASEHTSAAQVASTALHLVEVGKGSIIVVVVVANCYQSPSAATRSEFVAHLQSSLIASKRDDAGLVHVLDPPEHFYPPSACGSNVDVALLLRYAAPLAPLYLQVEPNCRMQHDFVDTLKKYLQGIAEKPWIMVLLTQRGWQRKLVRSRLLMRFAEMLLMFPYVSPDMLVWDWVDVVGNQTTPKAIYLSVDATLRRRPDIILQFENTMPLIDHLGDVSSLEGKVQRHNEDYFKRHPISDTMFDNPAGKMQTNLKGRPEMLQSLYDGTPPSSDVTCGGHTATECSKCPQGHGASWCNVDCMWVTGQCTAVYKSDDVTSLYWKEGYVELVFPEPRNVQMVNLRMGGQLTPAKECKDKKPCRNIDAPDDDFHNVLDDGQLELGHGSSGNGPTSPACDSYEKIAKAVGREIFWRSSQSRPVTGVRCVRVAMQKAQLRPLLIRSIQVRTTESGPDAGAASWMSAEAPGLPHDAALPREAEHRDIAAQSFADGQGALPHAGDIWEEQLLAWELLVSVAFISGAFAGVLGCVAKFLRPPPKQPRRRSA